MPAAVPARRRVRTAPFLKGRMPGQVIIQYTDRCNAACPQCGMRRTETFPRQKIDDRDVRRIIDACVRNGVAALSFTGGEPFLYFDEVTDHLRYAHEQGIPYLRTGTNGFIFRDSGAPDFTARMERYAEALAESGVGNVWISIDSADPATHERMRGLPGVLDGVAKALPVFHAYGIYPAANLGLNRNLGGYRQDLYERAGQIPDDELYGYFSESIGRFYRTVTAMGFTLTNACYPMSVPADGPDGLDAVYSASSADLVVSFTAREKLQLFRALNDVIPKHRGRIRIFTPRTALQAMVRQYESGERTGAGYPCRAGIDFFFIDSRDSNAYPCGYRGNDSLGKFWDLDVAALPNRPACTACDWECFRDPSELLGPLLELRTAPLKLAGRLVGGNRYPVKTWLEDLAYYRACGWFNGRKPPAYGRMARHAVSAPDGD